MLFRPFAWQAKLAFSTLVIIKTESVEKPAALSQQFARSTLYVLKAECLILYHDHRNIFVVLLLICSGAAVHIISACTARYITVVVLAAASAELLLRRCLPHVVVMLVLYASCTSTIYLFVQGSPPGRAQGSVLLHLDMSTNKYWWCWCCCTYRVVPYGPSLVVASFVTSHSRSSCCC